MLLFVILWNVFGTPLMESITPEEPPKIEEPIKQDLYVFVTGAVRKPGLYAFPTAVTVGDAIHAAGDALPYAAAEAVNYADKLMMACRYTSLIIWMVYLQQARQTVKSISTRLMKRNLLSFLALAQPWQRR